MADAEMKSRRRRLIRRASRFRKDQNGAGTIEFVVWLPFFLMLIVLAFDISITFYSMSRMWDEARYTARSVATGELSASAAQQQAYDRLPGHADFSVSVVDDDETDPFNITVTISSSNISPAVGFLELFSPDTLSASYVMRRETF